jgi:hypothetical protein
VEARLVGILPWMVGLLSLALLGGCGANKKAADDPSSTSDSEVSRGTPWKEKSREQRMDWMGLSVFPKMRAVFVEHDAAEGDDFSCQTCHGATMEMVDFKMPNRLFELSKTNTLADATEYDADTTQFMIERVVPEMAKLLDMEPSSDPSSSAGFGCFGCHPSN